MSKVENTQAEESFTGKLDINLVSTNMYHTLLEILSDAPRAVLCMIGMPGIGKTAIPQEVVRLRNSLYAAFHVPTLSVEDLSIPTTAVDTKRYYDKRISRKLQPLLDYCTRLREENGGKFPAGRNPILALEELNRAVDKHVTRALFTLIEDRMLGDTYIDPAIQIVVTMNPSGGSMAVNEFERDPAARRRLTMVGVTASYGDFINYARGTNVPFSRGQVFEELPPRVEGGPRFHPKIIEHLEAQPTWFYDEAALQAGKKFACPAAWETLSQVCRALERRSFTLDSSEARAAFAGTVGATAAEAFIEFVVDATVVITPEEVLSGYREGSTVKSRLVKLVQDSRMDKVSELCKGLVMKVLDGGKRKPETFGKQLALFMDDLPEDTCLAFVKQLNAQSKVASGGQKFFSDLNALMAKEPYFQTTMKRLQAARDAGEEEAKKSGFKT